MIQVPRSVADTSGSTVLPLLSVLALLAALACSVQHTAPERGAAEPAQSFEPAATGLRPAAPPSRGPPRAAALRAPGAVVFGSSSVKGPLGRLISEDLQRWGYQVTRRGIVSAGLARPDHRDLREVLSSLPIDEHTAAVFVYVGTNDAQSLWLRPSERAAPGARWISWQDPRWPELYRQRARGLFRAICQRGAERAIVLLPSEVAKAGLERRLRRIRRLQEQAARDTQCAIAVSTEGERGRFWRNGRRLRRQDGFHLSPLGARLIWTRVQRRASVPLASLAARSSALPELRAGERSVGLQLR